MRVLVALSNHGTKNDAYLARVLEEYRSMKHDVDIVVFTNVEKDLGQASDKRVEVRVGVPAEGPTFLPFLHRELFASRAGSYDVFLYSEDDVLTTQRTIEVFSELSALLDDASVPAFFFCEDWPDGRTYSLSIHGPFSWDLSDVRQVGGQVFAAITNLHSPVYALTRSHLRRALDSGAFLRKPRESKYYNVIEAATSDVFQQCGLRKLVCASRLRETVVKHLPIVMRFGVPLEDIEREVPALAEVAAGTRPHASLFETRSQKLEARLDKAYHGSPCPRLLEAVLPRHERVLSIGCCGGGTEEELVRRGHEVTAAPLDAVVAAVAAAKGIRILAPDLDSALREVAGEEFDCILLPHVLEHVPDPAAWLERASSVLAPGGRIAATLVNFESDEWWRRTKARSSARMSRPELTGRFTEDGVQEATRRRVREWFRAAGLPGPRIRYEVRRGRRRWQWLSLGLLGPRLGKRMVVISDLTRAPRQQVCHCS